MLTFELCSPTWQYPQSQSWSCTDPTADLQMLSKSAVYMCNDCSLHVILSCDSMSDSPPRMQAHKLWTINRGILSPDAEDMQKGENEAAHFHGSY